MAEESTVHAHPTEARFEHTHWTVVLAAADQRAPGAGQAIEQLCRTYWHPLYAFLRRRGYSPEDAQDLTQGLLAHLLANDRLRGVHPAKGKFRSFLLACLENYASHERAKGTARRRGSGQSPDSIDAVQVEEWYRLQPLDDEDPVKVFDRGWAVTLLERVMGRMGELCRQRGQGFQFEVLQPFLIGGAERGDFRGAAARLGLSEGAVRVAATRLRAQFRDLLREEVGRTVSCPAEIDDELRYLVRVLRGT